MPKVSVDDRGRVYLPKELREGSGGNFRAVKLEAGIKLIPVDEDPVEGLKKATNGAEGVEIEEISDKMDKKLRESVEEDF